MTEKMSWINKFCLFNFRNIKCHALSKKLCVRSLRLCFEFGTSANKLCSMSRVWWHVNSCLWHCGVYMIVRGGMSLATFVCHQQNMWYLHIYLILQNNRRSLDAFFLEPGPHDDSHICVSHDMDSFHATEFKWSSFCDCACHPNAVAMQPYFRVWAATKMFCKFWFTPGAVTVSTSQGHKMSPNAENKGLIWWYDTGKFLYIQNPKKDQVQ
jgi:hypothetical protein